MEQTTQHFFDASKALLKIKNGVNLTPFERLVRVAFFGALGIALACILFAWESYRPSTPLDLMSDSSIFTWTAVTVTLVLIACLFVGIILCILACRHYLNGKRWTAVGAHEIHALRELSEKHDAIRTTLHFIASQGRKPTYAELDLIKQASADLDRHEQLVKIINAEQENWAAATGQANA